MKLLNSIFLLTLLVGMAGSSSIHGMQRLKSMWNPLGVSATKEQTIQAKKCSICLEEFSASNAPVSALLCKPSTSHIFHTNCLNQWIEAGHRSCPICRKTVRFPLVNVMQNATQIMQNMQNTMQNLPEIDLENNIHLLAISALCGSADLIYMYATGTTKLSFWNMAVLTSAYFGGFKTAMRIRDLLLPQYAGLIGLGIFPLFARLLLEYNYRPNASIIYINGVRIQITEQQILQMQEQLMTRSALDHALDRLRRIT